MKQIWDVYKKVPAIHLVGNILLFPDEFLLSQAPPVANFLDRRQIEAVKTARVTYLNTCNQSLTKEAQRYVDLQSYFSGIDVNEVFILCMLCLYKPGQLSGKSYLPWLSFLVLTIINTIKINTVLESLYTS